MIEEYYKYKIEYKKYIIMIKVGNFYEILDKDAIIINNLLNYKLSKLSDTVKCGFPISSLEKVKIILKEKQINYIVVEKDKIVCKGQFEKNTYSNYCYDINTIKYNFIRIGKITKYLNENAFNEMNDLLDKIEESINGRR